MATWGLMGDRGVRRFLARGIRVEGEGWNRGFGSKIWDLQTWSGIIQFRESSKASERPGVDDADLVTTERRLEG